MTLDNHYYPMLVSEDGTLETETNLFAYREKVLKLDIPKRNILLSQELAEQIFAFGQRFSVSVEYIGRISAVIRKIFFGEMDWSQCEEVIRQTFILSGGNPASVSEAALFIKTDILTIVPRLDTENSVDGQPQPVIARMPLLEALAKYPQLGQQSITASRVKLRVSTEPARGSLLNWLRYYREELGVGYHDAMTRGQFLFRSQNGSRLTDEEHGRLGLILRSIEDHEMVEIDTDHQIIVFPNFVESSRQRSVETQSVQQEHAPQAQQIVSVPAPSSMPLSANPIPRTQPVETASPIIPTQLRNQVQVSLPTSPVYDGGSMHVTEDVESRPATQSLGTLQFSSKHVLPSEKDLVMSTVLPNQSIASEPLGLESQKPVSAQPTYTQPVQPPQAPKRHPGYIPAPFRIDPVGLSDRNE